ncbi:HAMP domain-containing histidine kinase [archaeon]|nr:MAG: HAMP domain-containing histidine kinase [archaeon]
METKRIFVRHVSHEIRTPLNTTILGLRLLDQELNTVNENRDETLLHDLVSDIDSSCAIAVDMLNDLLLYEKIEGGLVSLETTDVPVWDSMKEVLKVFRIQAKSLQIQLEYPDTCVDGYHIKVDKYKLSQVFRNLVSNALKFTSTNGTVKVQAQILSR